MEVWAHRGVHNADIPENTIPAFDAAYDAGVFGIELDVRMCGSGDPVVFHDSTVLRSLPSGTQHRVKIEDLSFRDLKEIRLNGKYAIPPLDMVLANYGHEIPLNLDIKSSKILDHRLEHSIVRLLEKYDLTEKVLISSDNPLVLWSFKALMPQAHLAWVMNKKIPVPLWRALPIEAVHVNKDLLNHKLVRSIRKSGKSIRAWTCNEYHDLKLAGKYSLNGIFTDRSAYMVKYVGSTRDWILT